jgi:phage gp29-like protein
LRSISERADLLISGWVKAETRHKTSYLTAGGLRQTFAIAQAGLKSFKENLIRFSLKVPGLEQQAAQYPRGVD